MRPAVLWLRLFATGFAVVFVLLVWTVLTPRFEGDLARVGRLSETQFHGSEPQPSPRAEHLRGVPLAQADVVVIGDSFSVGLVWQSALVKAGYRVTTLLWNDTGPLCGDLDAWLARAGFRGRLVLVESVERELDQRTRDSLSCSAMRRAPRELLQPPPVRPPRRVLGLALNWDESIGTGILTTLRTRRAMGEAEDIVFGDHGPDGARLRRVSDGCQRFSHRLCGKALFFAKDQAMPALSSATLQRMQALSARHARLMWVVMPDKTSVYLQPERGLPVGPGLVDLKLGPDLFDFAIGERTRMRDFYLPDDSHPSPRGFMRIGERLTQAVREAIGGPA